VADPARLLTGARRSVGVSCDSFRLDDIIGLDRNALATNFVRFENEGLSSSLVNGD
jgi:hypothetical protein